jgi:branched-chain amino acid transport system permease protein
MDKRIPLAILGVGALMAFVPLLGLPAFYDSLLYLMLHWIVLATSWNILSGYSGYFSFGHGAFFGAGLYTSTTLLARFDWPFLYTLPVAALVAAVLGVALGAVVFRVKGVRGELFALLTLAVTFVLGTVILNTPIDGGQGVSLAAVPVPAIGPTQSSTFYLLALAAAVVTMLAAYVVHASKLGVGLFAIHDDEDAAEVMGVPTYRYKLVALAISCALAGVAGGIHALFLNYVTVGEVFTITVPLTVVLMSILGGTRHWAGPAIGAVAITALLYSFTGADYAVLGKALIGAILIAAILLMPDGLLSKLQGLLSGSARPNVDTPPLGHAGPGSHAAAATATSSGSPVASGSVAAASSPASSASAASISSSASNAPATSSASAADTPTAATSAASVPAAEPASLSASTSGPAAVATTASRPAGDVLLQVRGLAKSFKGLKALAGVDLDVRRGEILGLLGPNGSGKSTFINLVSGHYTATAGQVIFEGREMTRQPAHRVASAGIARTYQIPRPFAHLPVLDNVALAAMFGGESHSPEAARREARQWLEFTGLEAKANALPDTLNLHQRKFLELARALASRPRLVLLDEVLCGLTPSEMDEAVALIRRIREQGSTIVFVEHVMRAVMALTDRIAVLNHGVLLAEGSASQVMQRPDVMTAYLGKAHA